MFDSLEIIEILLEIVLIVATLIVLFFIILILKSKFEILNAFPLMNKYEKKILSNTLIATILQLFKLTEQKQNIEMLLYFELSYIVISTIAIFILVKWYAKIKNK